MKFYAFYIIFILMASAWAEENSLLPKGKLRSPYLACENQLIVDEMNYQKFKDSWNAIEQKCQAKIILAPDIGLTSLDPLKEGVKYLEFSQRVAKKVKSNLIKSRNYAECSAACFSGQLSCKQDKEIINCKDRKNDIVEAMKVYSRKLRMELALSQDAPGLINVNIHNVLSLSKEQKEKLINKNLRDFEIGTPNPLGRNELTEREYKEAERRVNAEIKKLEEEYSAKGYKNYSDWMSVKLMERFDHHQEEYRRIVYEEAPLFGVIDRPLSFDSRNDPVWSEKQLADAFLKLSANSKLTEAKVDWSIQNGKLEFDRVNTEALKKWAQSFDSKRTDTNDLLVYVGMKNAVEEVLKEDPASCGLATAMEARLRSKEMQNNGVTLAASISTSLFGRLGGSTFGILKSLGGAEIARVTGLAIGSTYLGDNFRKYNLKTTEAQTLSGLGGKDEGVALMSGAEIAKARENLKNALMFSTVDTATAWNLGRKIYSSFARQIEKELPEASALLKSSNDAATKDMLTDKWLAQKLKADVDSGLILNAEADALKSEEGKRILNSTGMTLTKNNPDYFKDPKNITQLFKASARSAMAKKAPLQNSSHLGEVVETYTPFNFPESMRLRKYKNKLGEEFILYEKVIVKDNKNIVVTREVSIDPATGAIDANYPAGKKLLEDLIKEKEGKATFAFIDVNNLGYVNKNFFKGREAGDAYLAAIAKAVNKATDGKAQLFKLGGDEYGVLLHEADPKLAKAQLQKIIEECYSKEVHSIFKDNTILRAKFVRKELGIKGPGDRYEIDPATIQTIKDYAPYSKEGISLGAASIKKGNTLEELLSSAEAQATAQKIKTKTELNISSKKYGGTDAVAGARPNLKYQPSAEEPVVVAAQNKIYERPYVSKPISSTHAYAEDQAGNVTLKTKDFTVAEYTMADGTKILKYDRMPKGSTEHVTRELVVNAKTGLIDGTHESGKFILKSLADGKDAVEQSRGLIWINAENLGKINYFKSGSVNGDKLLFETARILKKELKESGLPIKMQGSEFVVIQNGVSKEKLEATMKRINQALINNPEIKSIFTNQMKYLEKELAGTNPANIERTKELKDSIETMKTLRPEFSMESHLFKAQDDLTSALHETRELNYSRRQ